MTTSIVGHRKIKVDTSKLLGVRISGTKIGATKPIAVGVSKPRG